MHWEKMAVTDISFHQPAGTEFLVKEGKLGGSHRSWVKHCKDGNTDIADQPRCGRQRTAATERNKQKVDELIRQDRRITFRETAAQLGVGHQASE
jgi:hypothetical protein